MRPNASAAPIAAGTAPSPIREASTARPSCARPDEGLRSARGIHWLLLAGALITGVSAYRLIAARWAELPVAAQFLTLAGGALALFAAGDVCRHRLALRQAGSALLLLFAGLVPVLAWGAARLDLVEAPFGLPAAALGLGALVCGAIRVHRTVLGEPGGRTLPAAIATLTVAPAGLRLLAHTGVVSVPLLYASAALGLGAALHAASLHANRERFHRDRRDGIDRPVPIVPFLLLGAHYAAALAALDPRPRLVALPLAVLGSVLVATGDEYVHALAEARGRAPRPWPGRSAALLGLGLALAVGALPLALLDPAGRTLPVVALLAAASLLRVGLRHGSALAHTAGLLCVLLGYHTLPALAPAAAEAAFFHLSDVLGLAEGSPGLLAFGHLPLAVALIGAASLLRRRELPARLHATHAALASLHLTALAALALLDRAAGLRFLPCALLLALAAVRATRRGSAVLAAHAIAAALVLSVAAEASGQTRLVGAASARALGLAALGWAIASRFAFRRLERMLEGPSGPHRVPRLLVLPDVAIALLVALQGAGAVLVGDPLGGLQVGIAGAVLLAAAHRLAVPGLSVLGAAAVTLGAALLTLGAAGATVSAFAPAALALFTLAWLAHRFARGSEDPHVATWQAGGAAGMAFNAIAGAHLLLAAVVRGQLAGHPASFEPFFLLAFGLALVESGLHTVRPAATGVRGPGDPETEFGLASLVAFVPVEAWTLGLIHGLPAGMALAGVALAAAIALARAWSRRATRPSPLARPLADLRSAWLTLATAVCLIWSGPAALGLSAVILAAAALRPARWCGGRHPVASLLSLAPIALAQTAVALAGHPSGRLLVDLLAQGAAVLPALAALLALWLVAADAWRRHAHGDSVLFAIGAAAEGVIALLVALAFLAGALAGSSPLAGAGRDLLLGAAALALAGRHAAAAAIERSPARAWLLQLWLALAALHALTAGWIPLGSGLATYGLMAVATLEYAAGALAGRAAPGSAAAVLADPARVTGKLAAASAALVSVGRALDGPAGPAVWARVAPAFLASLFFLVAASREKPRVAASLLSAGILNFALLAVLGKAPLGAEFLTLAPGTALLFLAYLLHQEMGRDGTRRVFTAGAAFVYATPVLALYDGIAWGWQAVLLVLAVGFGAASFALRSRSLLTLSTAALVVDLGFFVAMLRATEPLLLWAFGIAFGVGLMASAAWLEHRREGVLQQIRVFGQELRAWR